MNARIPLGDRSLPDSGAHAFDAIERSSRFQYISQMLTEMHKQAKSLDADTLSYLIEMAMLEAMQLDEIEKFQQDLSSGECTIEG